MNEHTPGPWEAENTNSGIMIKSTRKPGYLAAARWFTQSSKEIWANAYLIAAAPDLLAALKNLVDIIERDNKGDPDYIAGDSWRDETLELAQAAIVKAMIG